ncbi:MAG: AmmeMemoRadiSam system radical SAM enzyme [Myxococcota bacterium]|nr:AmmeMemoRadiSam system radical SAM enzyme [Myxococcota bacterium]
MSRAWIAPYTVVAEDQTALPGGRIRCDACPRGCTLSEGQRGFCFVREARDGRIVLTSYGRASGFCIDPIEKKPLSHFLPGTAVLSFGTAGCNLGCRFCQNWDISKARDADRLAEAASPEDIARAAERTGCRSVAYTYNDPVVFAEYAIDTAEACRARGIASVAVTAGYVEGRARERLFRAMDAANVDLKAFTEHFYRKLCVGELGPVLDTLRFIRHETRCWLEITTLLIPGWNDSDAEIDALASWIARELGPEVPLHLTAFHPDWKMQDTPATPRETLVRARRRAIAAGLHHVYTGNVFDPEGQSTYCAGCGALLVARDGYRIERWRLDALGRCPDCGRALAGRFEPKPGDWGPRRLRVLLDRAEA